MDSASPIDTAKTGSPAETPERLRWGPWATLAWGIPITLTLIVAQTAGAIGFLRWWRLVHPEHPIPIANLASNGAVLAFTLAASAPIVLGFLAFVVRLSHVPLGEYLALKRPRLRDVGIGAGAVLAVLLLTGVVAAITGQQTPEFMTDTYASARAAGMLPLLLFSFVILGPLQEEMLFRGFLFRGFATALGVWPTIALTAAAWALTHAQYQWFFVGEIFALGVALGWLRARSGSTLLTFALHALINGSALVEVALLLGP